MHKRIKDKVYELVGLFKLNSDACGLGNTRVEGVGGSVSGANGSLILSFKGPVWIWSINELVARIMLIGDREARKLHLFPLVTEGGFVCDISWAVGNCPLLWRMAAVVDDLMVLLEGHTVSFSYVHRKANDDMD